MRTISLKQGSEEWLDLRKKKITSTDAPIICGKNPFKTLRQLILEKQEILPPEELNAAMKKGSELESFAFEAFKEMVRDKQIPLCGKSGDFSYSVCGLYDEDDTLMSSFDGLSEDGSVVLEIKCGKKAFEKLVKHGEIPEYYLYQMQHAMLVAGASLAIYFCYWEKQTAWAIVPADKQIQYEILGKIRTVYYEAALQCLEEIS